MKIQNLFIICLLILASCNNDPRKSLSSKGNFGETISSDSALSVTEAILLLKDSNNMPVKVKGTIANYCKGEGCWLILKNDNGGDLLVRVEDKSFILPYHIDNKTVIAKGIIKKEEADGKEQAVLVTTGIIIE